MDTITVAEYLPCCVGSIASCLEYTVFYYVKKYSSAIGKISCQNIIIKGSKKQQFSSKHQLHFVSKLMWYDEKNLPKIKTMTPVPNITGLLSPFTRNSKRTTNFPNLVFWDEKNDSFNNNLYEKITTVSPDLKI